jgi:hypothetical protein
MLFKIEFYNDVLSFLRGYWFVSVQLLHQGLNLDKCVQG